MRIRPLWFIPLSLALGTSLYASPYSLSISAETTKFDYAETEYGQLLDTETSSFGDISGFSLTFEPTYQGLYVTTRYSSGDTDYIGGTESNPDYGSFRTTTQNTLTDTSAGYKTTFALDPHGDIELPFKIGFGYREWKRHIQSTPEVWGVEEIYDWKYFDLGAGIRFALSSTATVGIDASFQTAFDAEMSENARGYTFELENVHGYKIAVPLELELNPGLSLYFLYHYEYWNIDASDTVGGYYEPDSETKNETLSVGLKLRF